MSKKLDHTLAVRVQKGSAACKEVACIIIAARPLLHNLSDTYTKTGGCPHASRRDPPLLRLAIRRADAAAAPQHIIILYFIAICRDPRACSA